MYWNNVNDYLQKTYGCKVYKLGLSTGCSCPNRDGTLGNTGCIFCDGSDAFTAAGSIQQQLLSAKHRVQAKVKGSIKYIAYFQSFTNTYASPQYLRPLFMEAITQEDVVALSIATRPDCLAPDILELLSELVKIKPVWVELGLQTIHPETAQYIRRGYPLEVYAKAVKDLKSLGITVITHQILGLPGETPAMMVETSRYIGQSGADGIKLHLLHVLKDTPLAVEWSQGHFSCLELEQYIDILLECLRNIPREMVVHRLTGDGAKSRLLAPLWSGNKKLVLNAIHKAMVLSDVEQGSAVK